MRKVYLILAILGTWVLAGCLPTVQATPTSTATSKPQVAPTVILTVPAQSAIAPSSGCTVVSQKPTPGPTEVSKFPPVSETDWVKGPASAQITIIEYSDFQ